MIYAEERWGEPEGNVERQGPQPQEYSSAKLQWEHECAGEDVLRRSSDVGYQQQQTQMQRDPASMRGRSREGRVHFADEGRPKIRVRAGQLRENTNEGHTYISYLPFCAL